MVQRLRKKTGGHPSIFIIILWLNVLSIIIVSGFNYFVFHRMSDTAYLESFVQYNRSVTEMAFRNIDTQIIQPVIHIPQLYFSATQENEPLLKLQEGNPSHREISDFVAEMNRLENSYPFVKSMDIYYEGAGIAVTGFNRVHFPESEERLHQYLPWYKAWKQGDGAQGFLETPVAAYSVEEPVITYVKKVPQAEWNGKSIVLAIHISPYSFGDYINEAEGGLAVLAQNGHTLYDTASYGEPQLSAEAILAQAQREGINWEQDGTPVTLQISGNQIAVFHMSSTATGLAYLYRMENSRFYRDYDATKQMFLMNFILSIGFNLLIFALVSYYNYQTYRKRVLSASKEAGLVFGHDNQSFNSSLNLLTKEISVLHKTINSSKGLLFQSEVRSILLNKTPDAAYEKLNAYLTGSHVCVYFVSLSEEDDIRLSVEELQEAYKPGTHAYDVLFTTVEKVNLVAVLLCDEARMQAAEDALLSDLKQRWESCRAVSGLVLPVQKCGIANSYKSVTQAAQYCYVYPHKARLTCEELHIDARKNGGSHLRLFEMLERDIKSENLSDFKDRLQGLAASFTTERYTIDYCISTLRDLIALFYQIMQQTQLDMWVLFGYDIREYYKQLPNIEEFYEWGSYLGETIIRSIKEKKQSVDTGMKDKITSFVEKNLENGITLDYLADQLHLRQDVASRMFRQAMGQGYTEYMKEKKLNRAIELLEQGSSVKDIAERLGYSSAQYFIKVFKETYGVTPYKFKKTREEKEL